MGDIVNFFLNIVEISSAFRIRKLSIFVKKSIHRICLIIVGKMLRKEENLVRQSAPKKDLMGWNQNGAKRVDIVASAT